MLPALLKRLLDEGFGPSRSFPLWIVPVVIVGLYIVRGLANFVAQYALAWGTNLGVLNLRDAMFDRLLDAAPPLFAQQSASMLTNTMVYEVQGGAMQLVQALMVLVRDTLIVAALLFYLLYLNWRLTLAGAGAGAGGGPGHAPGVAAADQAHARLPGSHRRAGLRGRGKRARLAHRSPARRGAGPSTAASRLRASCCAA